MHATTLALALALLGVNYSWQPVGDGSKGSTYTVQVEPELLESLAAGQSFPIESHIPADARPIHKIRIVFGDSDEAGTDSRGPIERTSFRQPPPAWSGNGTTTGTARYDNTATNPLRDAGEALVDATRSGVQQAGQHLQNAGRDLGSAANELTGGTLGRAADAIRQPFQTGAGQGPLETMSTVANDLVRDGREQLNAAGQFVRDATGQVMQNSPARPNYNNQPNYGTTQGNPYAGQPANASVPPPRLVERDSQGRVIPRQVYAPPLIDTPAQPATTGTVRDPGSNPFGAGLGATSGGVNGPALQTGNQNSPFASDDRRGDWNTSRNNELVTVQPVDNRGGQASVPNPGDRYNNSGTSGVDPWLTAGGARNNQSPFATIGGANNQSPQTNTGYAQQGSFGNSNWPPGTQTASQTNTAGYAQQQPSTQYPQQQTGFANQPVQQLPAEKPWGPFLLAGLGLIGSLGANLFLGFSYLDARHKYLSAIRRGTRSLGRDAA